MKNILDKLSAIISSDNYFLDENGEIIKEKIKTCAVNLDPHLLNVLVSDNDLKNAFFKEINGVLVFDKVKFSWLISNSDFLPDSFTSYKNKIGLIDDEGVFIKNRDDVTLSFPYKDCLLEFDSTDQDEDRDEIFLNETLAKNQIDVLLSPKAVGNAKLYKGGKIKDVNSYNGENLIIKGNNLIAMHSLLKRFEGQIKCMYWDILYNTKDDNVPYNDSFKHSSWLTMMKNRLEVSRKLLREDGTIVIQCDDNEMAYLKVLCDEIYGRDNLINTICVKMSELKGFKMGNLSNKFPKLKEFLLIYGKNKSMVSLKIETVMKDNLEQYTRYYNKRIVNINEPCSKWRLETVGKDYDKIGHANEMIYIVTRDSKIKEELPVNQFVENIDSSGKKSYLIYDGRKVNTVLFLSDYIKEPLGDIWMDISTININKESSVQLNNGKKPENLLRRIIYSLTNENDYILDAYFGTGTTGAVAMKMGRKFIGLEQLDDHYEKCVQRLKEVSDGEQSGVSEEFNWKGGGSFIYCELLKNNLALIEKINSITDEKDAISLLESFLENPCILNYNANLELLKNGIDSFKGLSLDDKKKVLITILEKNILYVQESEIDDDSIDISKSDKEFTKSFYTVGE